MGRYLPGNRVIVDFVFEPYEGEPRDPDEVTATLRNPVTDEETDITTEVSDPAGAGAFTVSHLFPAGTEPGDWRFLLAGSGNGIDAALEHVITITASTFDTPVEEP